MHDGRPPVPQKIWTRARACQQIRNVLERFVSLAASSASLRSSALDADDDVDAPNRGARRWRGQAGEADAIAGDIDQLAGILKKEMVVVARIGIEIGAARIDHDFAQQSGADELVQRVVDGGERHRHGCGDRLTVQLLGADMPITLLEQQAGEGQALPRRSQPRRAEQLKSIGEGTCAHAREASLESQARPRILPQAAAASKGELAGSSGAGLQPLDQLAYRRDEAVRVIRVAGEAIGVVSRSEERRVGKECRYRW